MSVCVCVCAVSYTHLDVYKRQALPHGIKRCRKGQSMRNSCRRPWCDYAHRLPSHNLFQSSLKRMFINQNYVDFFIVFWNLITEYSKQILLEMSCSSLTPVRILFATGFHYRLKLKLPDVNSKLHARTSSFLFYKYYYTRVHNYRNNSTIFITKKIDTLKTSCV